MKYKEAFSASLVDNLIDDVNPSSVLDPFAGIGTTPLAAAGRGLRAAGIEIMPVGILAGRAIALASNGLRGEDFRSTARDLLHFVRAGGEPSREFAFPHVRITEAAFPEDTEADLARAREFLASVDDPGIRSVLDFACMSVLEATSYTRKDGQYLRWDYRSGRSLRARVHKGPIESFASALSTRFEEISEDLEALKIMYGNGFPELIEGSSLDQLRRLPGDSFDLVVTSPPYANRYDYTRTYALELAWLGYGGGDLGILRQRLLSATVENRSKRSLLREGYGTSQLLEAALEMYEGQPALLEVLNTLRAYAGELSNRHVIRLLEGYFLEMAVVIAELGRIVMRGGAVFMVNDNVQYHGEEVPVDLILSDFAEKCGFACEHIWALPRGKGNSSQQMGRFGRRELRKCVYKWVRCK